MTVPRPLIAPGDTIVFEGDSQSSRQRGPAGDTWAYLRMCNWHRTYNELVEEWLFANLPELHLTCRHAARSGSAIMNLEERYETCVKPLNPDLMVFTIGNNDTHRIELNAFTDRLSAYLDRLQDDAGTKLLYVGGYEACPLADEGVGPRCDRARPYNDAAGRVVTERGGVYLNIGPSLRRKAEKLYEQSACHSVYAEGRHLNALGSHIVAGQVLRAMGAFHVLLDQGD